MAEIAFIDSNIIVFSNIKNAPEYFVSLSLLEDALKGKFIGCINTIIAIETHYKLLAYINSTEAKLRVGNILDSRNIRFFNVTKGTLKEGFVISEKYKIRTNDSVIIASMVENDIKKIYTNNEKDFKKHPELEVINPLTEN